jgi:hypothetical protein
MAWHLEAVGSGGVRGTGDKKTMKLAAELYESRSSATSRRSSSRSSSSPASSRRTGRHLQDQVRHGRSPLLPEGLGQVRPGVRLGRRRGPQRARGGGGRLRVGALLPEHLHARPTRTVEDKKGTRQPPVGGRKGRRRAASRPAAKKYAPKEFTDNQKGMVTAFNRYICYIKPAANDKEAQEQYVEVKYARARTYFEAQHWEEAALGVPRRRA